MIIRMKPYCPWFFLRFCLIFVFWYIFLCFFILETLSTPLSVWFMVLLFESSNHTAPGLDLSRGQESGQHMVRLCFVCFLGRRTLGHRVSHTWLLGPKTRRHIARFLARFSTGVWPDVWPERRTQTSEKVMKHMLIMIHYCIIFVI